LRRFEEVGGGEGGAEELREVCAKVCADEEGSYLNVKRR